MSVYGMRYSDLGLFAYALFVAQTDPEAKPFDDLPEHIRRAWDVLAMQLFAAGVDNAAMRAELLRQDVATEIAAVLQAGQTPNTKTPEGTH